MKILELKQYCDNEEANAILNANEEYFRRIKQSLNEEDIERFKEESQLIINCFHDFGYEIKKVEQK